MAGIAASLGNIATGITNALSQQNQSQWAHGGYSSMLDILMPLITQMQGRGQAIGENLQPTLFNEMFAGRDAFGQLAPEVQAQLQQYMQNVNNGYNNLSVSGDQRQGLDPLLAIAGQLGGNQDLAGQVFAGGGWTPQGQAGTDLYNQLMNPGNQGELQNVMNELLSNRGQSQMNLEQGNMAQNLLSRGGLTNYLDDALKASNVQLALGGYTGDTRTGIDAGLEQLMNSGRTAGSDFMQTQGATMLSQNPLMTPEQAALYAREQVSNSRKNEADNMMEIALQRGGGPGARMAGSQNSVYDDLSDKFRIQEKDAMIDALMKQQALGLQSQQMGANLLGGGVNAETQRFATGGDVAAQMEQLRLQNYLGATNNTINASEAQTANLGLANQLGNSSEQNQLARMQLGGDLNSSYYQNLLGAGAGNTNLLGSMNQYALGAGGLQNQYAQNQGNLYQGFNTGYNNSLNTNANALNQQSQNALAGIGQQNNLAQYYGNYSQNAYNPLLSLSGQNLNSWQGGLGVLASMFGPAAGQAAPSINFSNLKP